MPPSSIDDEAVLLICLVLIMSAVALGQLDGRSLRGEIEEQVVVRSDFFALMVAQRSRVTYHKTLRCSPDSFDALQRVLEPRYYAKYGHPHHNTRYKFDIGLAVLLTYYGNGCGEDGDGIGGAANQLGMSRTSAGRYIKRLEYLLFEMMDEVVRFPKQDAATEWKELTDGFASRGGSFPDVACVFDGTLIRTRRPKDFQGFYDKNGKPSYNCLAAIDYRNKFRYFGVFSGSNSDQSMWNQSRILGANARNVCPPGVNWLGDSGFKLWPFLMVPFDERGGKRLSKKQRCFNYHLSATRILVECVFGKIKGRFKILHGVTDRKSHEANTRMICAAVVLHNLLVDVGDDEQFELAHDDAPRQTENSAGVEEDQDWDRTAAEVDLAIAKRNTYMIRFYRNDRNNDN